MDEYSVDLPDFIVFLITEVSISEELKLDNVKIVSLNKGITKKKEVKRNFNINVLPLTYNEKFFGNLLMVEFREKILFLL